MSGREIAWYVLFYNHTQGLKLNQLLSQAGIRNTIVPTPRKLSRSCGISLMLAQEDVPRVKEIVAASAVEIIEISALEKDIDPARDKYC